MENKKEETGFIGGIDIGGTKVMCAIADRNKNIIKKVTFQSVKDEPLPFLQNCVNHLADCAEQLGLKVNDLEGIGVTLPGMVDNRGILLFAPFLKWENIDVTSILKDITGVKNIRCDCDVNACAIAEAKIADCDNLLWITVSTGIGGAFIADGKIFTGYNFIAGEIGHTKVEYEKPRVCSCSQKGCAEAHASGTAVTKIVQELCSENPEFNALFEKEGISRDAKGCAVLANKGEPLAIQIFDTAGDYLGRAIANAVNIVNPKVVYIGGGMGANSFSLLEKAIRKRLNSDAVAISKDIPVLCSKIGYEAALVGALNLI